MKRKHFALLTRIIQKGPRWQCLTSLTLSNQKLMVNKVWTINAIFRLAEGQKGKLVQHARLLWGPQRWSGLEWWPPVLPPQPTACNRMLAGAGGKELRDSQRFQVISRHSKSQSVLFWHRSLPWTSSLWFLFCKVVWLFTWGPGNWRKWDKRGESEVGELAGLIRFLSCAVATSRRGKFNFGP